MRQRNWMVAYLRARIISVTARLIKEGRKSTYPNRTAEFVHKAFLLLSLPTVAYVRKEIFMWRNRQVCLGSRPSWHTITYDICLRFSQNTHEQERYLYYTVAQLQSPKQMSLQHGCSWSPDPRLSSPLCLGVSPPSVKGSSRPQI